MGVAKSQPVMQPKKAKKPSTRPYTANGYTIQGNHLVKENTDGSKIYLLMYKRSLGME